MSEMKYQEFDPRAFYRKAHPEYFSDSSVRHEVELTRDLFEFTMSQLATRKQHSDFEKFVIAIIARKITPNIMPQSGPDGGGDGKIDAETYSVSDDISDKWYSIEGRGASGEEKWAIAISCKDDCKPKIKSDVEKIVATNRGYSRILCFTSQVVKGNTRVDLEESLSSKYSIAVKIFDRTWLTQAVFDQGCYDIAIDKLPFDEAYKRKKILPGPMDIKRRSRFDEIEKGVLRHVANLDTGYISLLQESYVLAREMELPKDDVYGLFRRALDACERYGTFPQKFNIFYDRAWTAVFWFADFEQAYRDYLVIKEFASKEISVVRVEKLSNLLSVFCSAARYGMFDTETASAEMSSFMALLKEIENDPAHRSSYLFAKLFDIRCRLATRFDDKSEMFELVSELRNLLLEEAPKHIEISLKSQFQSLEILSNLHKDCEPLDDLVDDLAILVSQAEGEIAQADARLKRAQSSFEKGRFYKAIEHLGFCVRAYDREECQDRLIKAAGLMGMALWQLRLPYSAEAYLSKAACFLFNRFKKEGYIPHLLHAVLRELCEIELFLGRLVMYLNWHRLAYIVSNDAQYKLDSESIAKRVYMEDAAWLCRFSIADLQSASIAKLPDVLDREGLCISADYLRYSLGYEDEVSEEAKRLFEEGAFDKQPVFEQFLDDLNVSSYGAAYARTTVNNLTVRVDYENSIKNQNVAEILLASVEALFATTKQGEIAPLNPEVCVKIEDTGDATTLMPTDDVAIYILRLNNNNSYDSELWDCCAKFASSLFARNIMTKSDPIDYIDLAQENERTMDRVNAVHQLWMAKDIILGRDYPHLIESWVQSSDRIYGLCVEQKKFAPKKCRNEAQLNMPTYVTTQDRELWAKAVWCGTMFLVGPNFPSFIGLMFDNITEGRRIVEEWRAKSVRGEPTVKIAILRGIDRLHPTWYRVGILPDFDLKSIKSSSGLVSIMCQRNTMMPNDSKNLDMFERVYNIRGECWVAAVDPKTVESKDIKEVLECSMPIRSVQIKYVHELKDGDDAVMTLMEGDDPYVPEGCVLSNSVTRALEILEKDNH